LRFALSEATGDIILQTDADCIVSQQWVEYVVGRFDDETQLVLGPLTYRVDSNSYVLGLLEAEQSVLSGLTASGVALGQPIMSNAANMAYRRTAVDPVLVLGSSGAASGDDQEIVQEVGKKYGSAAMRFAKDAQAIVRTEAPQSVSEFWNQRLRWASKVSFRSDTASLDLLLFPLVNLCVVVLAILAFLDPKTWEDGIWLFLLFKYPIDMMFFLNIWPFYRKNSCRCSNLILDSLVLVIFYPFYTFIFAVLSKFVPFKWKNQKIAPWTRSSGIS